MTLLKHEEIRPFGPTILKFSLPDFIVDELNKVCESVIGNKKLERKLDFSKNLAGKVKQEFSIPIEALNFSSNFFFKTVQTFIQAYDIRSGGVPKKEINKSMVLAMQSAWFVRSFAGDYNPVHVHPTVELASVGYLKLPDWKDEIEKDEKDHNGLTHGCIQFVHGDSQIYSKNTYTIKPKVGDFYLFPSWLPHHVYPFRSAGERRSFSINFLTRQSN
jgi:hypothetical protein